MFEDEVNGGGQAIDEGRLQTKTSFRGGRTRVKKGGNKGVWGEKADPGVREVWVTGGNEARGLFCLFQLKSQLGFSVWCASNAR